MNRIRSAVLPFACALLVASRLAVPALAEDNGAELAMKLSNPVAALISVPLQLNWDKDIGPSDGGERVLVNVQPVIPIGITDDWNLISRTILPLVYQDDVFPRAGDQAGTGDTLQSAFFSPKTPSAGGWIWGAGPVLLLPTASDNLLGGEKWGAGPTAVVLRQSGPWTYGALGNHVWSFAGDDGRQDISTTFIQPFLAYTTPTAWTFTLNSESTYDWENEDGAVPINGLISKVTRLGGQLISLGGGVRYWAESTAGGPEGVGLRLVVTLLFPA